MARRGKRDYPSERLVDVLTGEYLLSVQQWHAATGGSPAFARCPPPLTRLATAAASNGLLTVQILFSLAFVGSCELANWISIMW